MFLSFSFFCCAPEIQFGKNELNFLRLVLENYCSDLSHKAVGRGALTPPAASRRWHMPVGV